MGVGAGLYMYDVVVKNSLSHLLSPDEFSSCFVSAEALPVLGKYYE